MYSGRYCQNMEPAAPWARVIQRRMVRARGSDCFFHVTPPGLMPAYISSFHQRPSRPTARDHSKAKARSAALLGSGGFIRVAEGMDMPQLSTCGAHISSQGLGDQPPWERTSRPGSMAAVSSAIHLRCPARFS